MNPKVLIAFIGGAVIASGIVFMAVRPEETPRPAPVVVTSKPLAPPAVQQAAVQEPTTAVQEPVPTATPTPVPRPVREKPSPVRPPARQQQPVAVARYERPMQIPAPPPAPLPEPINKERPYNDAQPAEPTPMPAPAPEPPPQPAVIAPPATVPPVIAPPVTAPLAPQPEPPQAPPAAFPETRVPNTVTIQPGTVLTVRIGETLSAARHEVGDTFLATLEQPLVIDGFIIAERGSRVEGRVVEVDRPGRGRGASHLSIELSRLFTSDGQRVHLRTEPFKKEAGNSTGSDLAKVGVGAAIGAAIGAAAGGGKGAAIGAGVGGAAGTAGVLLTRGKSAEIPVETRISFRVREPLTLTERLQY